MHALISYRQCLSNSVKCVVSCIVLELILFENLYHYFLLLLVLFGLFSFKFSKRVRIVRIIIIF